MTNQPLSSAETDRYKYIEIDQLKTRIYTTGNNKQDTIIYIHGNLGSIYDLTLSPLHNILSDKFNLVAYDRPGLGLSERSFFEYRMSPFEFADHLEKLRIKLDISDPIVMGHSWGGAVALAYALKYPEKAKSLILLAPASHPWPNSHVTTMSNFLPAFPVIGDIYNHTLHLILSRLFASSVFRKIAKPTELPDNYISHALPHAISPRNYKNAARDTMALYKELKKMSVSYDKITIPTLIFADPDDQIVWTKIHAQNLASQIQKAKLELLKDSGHLIQFSHAEIIAEVINSNIP